MLGREGMHAKLAHCASNKDCTPVEFSVQWCSGKQRQAAKRDGPQPRLHRPRKQGDVAGSLEVLSCGCANSRQPELDLSEHTHKRKQEAERHPKT